MRVWRVFASLNVCIGIVRPLQGLAGASSNFSSSSYKMTPKYCRHAPPAACAPESVCDSLKSFLLSVVVCAAPCVFVRSASPIFCVWLMLCFCAPVERGHGHRMCGTIGGRTGVGSRSRKRKIPTGWSLGSRKNGKPRRRRMRSTRRRR